MASLKQAMDFPTQEALDLYVKKHKPRPGTKHTVKGKSPGKEESSKPKKRSRIVYTGTNVGFSGKKLVFGTKWKSNSSAIKSALEYLNQLNPKEANKLKKSALSDYLEEFDPKRIEKEIEEDFEESEKNNERRRVTLWLSDVGNQIGSIINKIEESPTTTETKKILSELKKAQKDLTWDVSH